MREIKFRAWDKRNNKMRPQHGVLAKIEWEQDYTPFKIGVYEYVQIDEEGNCDWDGFELEKHEFELMQYTGLKDKNGKEIYEGDIVNFTFWWFDGTEQESNLCGEVVYLEDVVSFGLKHVKNSEWCEHTGANREIGDTDAFGTWRFADDDFEVIGNIHENPELLHKPDKE